MTQPLQAFFFRDFPNSYMPDILEEIYLKKVYEPFLLGKKNLIIADIGGNTGLTTYYFKDYAKQVYIIEPAKEHQETIKTLLAYNKITNVTLCPYAISNKDGTTKFYHNTNTTSHSLSLISNTNDYEEIETLSFDTFMQRNKLTHLDLLKMDSEGEEAKIFASDGFKQYADKIKVIVGEYHAWTDIEKHQFANLLTDLGFTFHWLPNTRASVFTAIRL